MVSKVDFCFTLDVMDLGAGIQNNTLFPGGKERMEQEQDTKRPNILRNHDAFNIFFVDVLNILNTSILFFFFLSLLSIAFSCELFWC